MWTRGKPIGQFLSQFILSFFANINAFVNITEGWRASKHYWGEVWIFVLTHVWVIPRWLYCTDPNRQGKTLISFSKTSCPCRSVDLLICPRNRFACDLKSLEQRAWMLVVLLVWSNGLLTEFYYLILDWGWKYWVYLQIKSDFMWKNSLFS